MDQDRPQEDENRLMKRCSTILLLILDKYRDMAPEGKTAADVQQQRTQPDTETYCRHLRN